MQKDVWVWGTETILWGFERDHRFTFKLLEPKRGKEGCLSLQYHNEKSECWFQLSGSSWILVVVDDTVATKILRPGDFIQLPTGTIHRMMGHSSDCKILEPSTPDAHAADKAVRKDVVRLHCVLGRACEAPRSDREAALVAQAAAITEEACCAIDRGEEPRQIAPELIERRLSYHIPCSDRH